jgi:NitT/TauT family transport system permease protein
MAEALRLPAALPLRLLRRLLWRRRWLALAGLLGAWQAIAMLVDVDLFPTPAGVWEPMRDVVSSGLFLTQLGDSMLRIATGFSLGLALGTLVGLLMGARKFWNDFFQDLIVLGLSLPGLIYALLAVMIFGLNLTAHAIAIGAATLPFVAVNIREGVRTLDKELLDMCRVYRVERARLIRQVVAPALMPFMMAAIRIGFTVAWKVAVLSEVFGATSGIGYQMRYNFQIFSIRGIVAWSLLFGIVMLMIEYGALIPLEKHVGRWRPRVKQVI